jgi:serine/threonine-protein kinase OSR1/STK39
MALERRPSSAFSSKRCRVSSKCRTPSFPAPSAYCNLFGNRLNCHFPLLRTSRCTFSYLCRYLHINGFIHRDIKAANLLIDDDGTVLLGDLGVAVSLSEDPTSSHSTPMTPTMSSPGSGGYYYSPAAAAHSNLPESTQATAVPISRSTSATPTLGRRRSFVGTPCWMAPEVISQKSSSSGVAGYNASADIYSLGITAIELAQGRAPHSLDPPYKALLKTLQNASPTLDRGRGHGKGLVGKGGGYKYSKELKDIVDACLQKDPTKRPTAHELLQTPYLKGAKKKDYLVDVLLKGLPPLTLRQERRVLPTTHGTTLHSIRSSWDFGASIFFPPSPGSTHSQLHSPNRDRSSDSQSSHIAVVLPSQAVFPMEDEGEGLPEEEPTETSSESEATDSKPWEDGHALKVYPSPRATPTDDTSRLAIRNTAMSETLSAAPAPMSVPAPKMTDHPSSDQITPPLSLSSAASSVGAGDKNKWSLGGTLGRTSSRLLGAALPPVYSMHSF